jgi:predicted NUDIX family NTP pyrophosphohydrolase
MEKTWGLGRSPKKIEMGEDAEEDDFVIDQIRSVVVGIEWQPRSGRVQYFPEIDRLGWFALPIAREKIPLAQASLLDHWQASRTPERLPCLCSERA